MATPIRLDRKTELSELADTNALHYHFASMNTPGNAYHLANSILNYDLQMMNNPVELLPITRYVASSKIMLETDRNKEEALNFLLFNRESKVEGLNNKVSLKELGYFLDQTHGMRDGRVKYRTVPSAGATHPLEIFIIVYDVKGLESGVYHHNIVDHSLERIETSTPKLEEVLSYPDPWKNHSCLVIFTLSLPRIMRKYNERGYRFALLEVGHASQNMLLSALQYNLNGVVLGNYFDTNVLNILCLDGIENVIASTIIF